MAIKLKQFHCPKGQLRCSVSVKKTIKLLRSVPGKDKFGNTPMVNGIFLPKTSWNPMASTTIKKNRLITSPKNQNSLALKTAMVMARLTYTKLSVQNLVIPRVTMSTTLVPWLINSDANTLHSTSVPAKSMAKV